MGTPIPVPQHIVDGIHKTTDRPATHDIEGLRKVWHNDHRGEEVCYPVFGSSNGHVLHLFQIYKKEEDAISLVKILNEDKHYSDPFYIKSTIRSEP